MALALNIGKCTLLGNYRENNEDAIDVKQFADLTLCLVADGMGGQAAGEIASKRATEVVPRELKKGVNAATTPEELKKVVRKAIVQANEEIIAMGALDRDLRNMGTTVVLAVWRKGPEIYVAGVGDSRAYFDPRRKDGAVDRRSLTGPGARRGQDHFCGRSPRPPFQERVVEVLGHQGGRRGS